jgi:hypothetical protein
MNNTRNNISSIIIIIHTLFIYAQLHSTQQYSSPHLPLERSVIVVSGQDMGRVRLATSRHCCSCLDCCSCNP